MKQAILPAIFSWIIGVFSLITLSIWTAPTSFRFPMPDQFLKDLFPGMFLFGTSVGIVVFPTCILAVAPLLKLLPRSSPLWKPWVATFCGALVAPFVMYSWAAVVLHSLFTPDYQDTAHIILGGSSAIVGATFAFLYAKAIQKSRSA